MIRAAIWGAIRAAVLAALLPGAVAAQPAGPRIRPVRDVAVTYTLHGPAAGLIPGGPAGVVTLFWDAAHQRLRAEAEGHTQVALVDLGTLSGQAMDKALHVAFPFKLRANDLGPLLLDGAKLTPGGVADQAGLRCRQYQFSTRQGPGTVCLTEDGVPLRAAGTVQGKDGELVAQSVRYGALPPGMFQVPGDYVALGGEDAGVLGGGKGGGKIDLHALGALLGRAGK